MVGAKTVLIVEDAKFVRLSLKGILERNGYQVIGEAENGYEGMAKYKELRPDIVTMDISMPEMDGLECMRRIAAFDPEAVMVVVSASSRKNEIKNAIDIGAKNFIIKPFKEESVILVLDTLLQKGDDKFGRF